jgi:hypothetical protein
VSVWVWERLSMCATTCTSTRIARSEAHIERAVLAVTSMPDAQTKEQAAACTLPFVYIHM